MAVSIAKLRAQLILDTENWLNGFNKAEKAAKSFAGGITSSIGSKVTGALAGIVSVGAAIHSLQSGMEQVDRQAKLADRLGITVAEVQKLSLAADLAGTDLELLAKSMLKMGKNIGSGGQSLDQRLFQVADSIASIKDAGKRAAEAERIFGKGGLELINVLTQGGAGIRASANAIDRFGLAISRIDAAKIEAANDSFTELTTVLGGLRNQVAVEIAPAITNSIQTWLTGLELLIKRTEDWRFKLKEAGGDASLNATFLDTVGALIWTGVAPAFGESGRGVMAGLREMKADALKNAALGGRNTGAGLLGSSVLGGSPFHRPAFASGAAERGTIEAGKLIQGVNGNPFTSALKPTNERLDKLIRNTDARRAGAVVTVGRGRL